MGYDLHAVIGGEEVLRRAGRATPAARSVPLGQGLSLMPMTDALLDALRAGDGGRALVFGPLRVDEGEPSPPAGSPVSQALRRLGVVTGPGEDEFSAVGLHRHRHDEAWVS